MAQGSGKPLVVSDEVVAYVHKLAEQIVPGGRVSSFADEVTPAAAGADPMQRLAAFGIGREPWASSPEDAAMIRLACDGVEEHRRQPDLAGSGGVGDAVHQLPAGSPGLAVTRRGLPLSAVCQPCGVRAWLVAHSSA
jgi:hypothetical protein